MPDYLGSIRSDGAAFADVVRSTPLDTDVPSCPGWTLLDLAQHLGHVHRWARRAVETARPPVESTLDPPPEMTDSARDADALADWLLDGVEALTAALAAVPDDAPTWHPFPVPMRAGVWPRRQAHELAIHRWDAEAAAGATAPMSPTLSADFVREYFEVIVPRVMARDGRPAPRGSRRHRADRHRRPPRRHVDRERRDPRGCSRCRRRTRGRPAHRGLGAGGPPGALASTAPGRRTVGRHRPSVAGVRRELTRRADGAQISRRADAHFASSRRSDSWSLRRTADMWVSTVLIDRTSSLATSR